jgi:Ran GTPase-activating protein (RanGAP) involved in mRNA processing and transport
MYYFRQALTTIDLSGNEIGAKGAEHLANALQQNKVTRLA